MPLMTAEERLGKTLDGKYRLDRILGEGGMGVVYQGFHVRLGRSVAVKFLHPQLSQNAEVVHRFAREAQSAARLQHPNVVDVRDIDTAEDGALYMVLELLAGETLAECLERQHQLTLEETLAYVLPCMDAIAVAHEHGIVHRDIKPDNIHLSRTPAGTIVPKVLDFGIAKLAHAAGAGQTGTGSLIGTPAYMAPEQAMGKKDVGPPADVWSMGCVIFECLTGRYPFDFPEDPLPTAVVVTVVTTEPYPISRFRPDLPPAFAQIVDRALQKNVASRFGNMREFVAALSACGITAATNGTFAAVAREPTGPHGRATAGSVTGPGAWSADLARQTGGTGSSPELGTSGSTGPFPASTTPATPFVADGRIERDILQPKTNLVLGGGLAFVAIVALAIGGWAMIAARGAPTVAAPVIAPAPTVAPAAPPPALTEAAPAVVDAPPPAPAVEPTVASPELPTAPVAPTETTHHGGRGTHTTSAAGATVTARVPIISTTGGRTEPPEEPAEETRPRRTGSRGGTTTVSGESSSPGGSSSSGGTATTHRAGSLSASEF